MWHCMDSLKLWLWTFDWENALKANIQDFHRMSKCPNHWFVLPFHWQQVPADSSFLRFHYAMLCQSFHSAITVLRGIYWVHSCKYFLKGTNRLLKTKLRSRNLSACHLYYLFCFICFHAVYGRRMETLPRSCASQRILSPEILSCLAVYSRFSISEQQARVASLSCGLLCAHIGVDGKRHICMLGMNVNPKEWEKKQWEE